MQREIKFKLLDISRNEVYPSFGFKDFSAGNFGEVFIASKYLHDISEGQIDKYRLLQYTGLLDINAFEIYEGDIVKCFLENKEIGHREYIEFNNGGFWLGHRDTFLYTFLENDGDFATEVEVIGNIFENPELLKSVQ